MKILLMMIIVFSANLFAFAQSTYTKTEREVLKANEDYDKAIVSRDVLLYEKVVAADFVFTDFRGVVSNKAQELEKIKTRSIKFDFGKSDDVRVKIYGKTAVVTGRFSGKGQIEGKDFSFSERYTAVFIKREKVWQLVAEQSTEIVQK